MIANASIRFPGLGIELQTVSKGFQVFGINIAFYGVIIAFGMLMGYLVAEWQARRTGQNPDVYLDFALYAVVLSVIGARIYYVIFSWDDYKNNLLQIFNLRGGGLAIYGGIITAFIVGFVYTKVKKMSFWLLADTGCVGLLTGQIIGRWGNFFNREVFGGYTDNLLAMQIKRSEVDPSNITPDILKHLVNLDGVEYIQVHPTFLYESLWNLGVLIIILLYTKHKKFDGELALLYIIGYGLGRAWIEGIRTDQLLFWGTNIAVSQVLSVLLVVVAAAFWIFKKHEIKKKSMG